MRRRGRPHYREEAAPPAITWLLIGVLGAEILAMASCAPKKYPIYQAPHMGAEYQFDQGMHAPKHKLGLFSKRMRKSMQQGGMP